MAKQGVAKSGQRTPTSTVQLRTRLAAIHYDIRAHEDVPKDRPPDVRSVAYLIEADSAQLEASEPATRQQAAALIAGWDRLIASNTRKIEAVKAELGGHSGAEPPEAHYTLPVPWDQPVIWRLIKLLLTMDDALVCLQQTREAATMSSNRMKTLRGKIVRPMRQALIEIPASSRRFRDGLNR